MKNPIRRPGGTAHVLRTIARKTSDYFETFLKRHSTVIHAYPHEN